MSHRSNASGAAQCRPNVTEALPALWGRRLLARAPDQAPVVPSALGPLPSPAVTIPAQPVQPGDSGNSSQVWDFGQCGGAGDTCPLADKTFCTDAAYLPCANATSSCTRISEWYWQVLLTSSLNLCCMRVCTHVT